MEPNEGIQRRGSLTPSRSIPLRHFDQPITPQSAAEQRLPFNKRVGLLVVGPRRTVGKGRRFFALCDCGTRVEGTALDILALIERGLGCGQADCSATSFSDVVWSRSEESVRIQLALLLRVCPEEVQSLWGGKLDDMWEVDFDQAAINLESYLTGTAHDKKSVWISRLTDDLPFMEGNVILSPKPDRMLKRMGSKTVDVGGQHMTIRELCQVTGLGASDLMMRIYKAGNTENLLERLLNWEDQ